MPLSYCECILRSNRRFPDSHRCSILKNGRFPHPQVKAMKDPYVYILASGMRGTLYIGVTSDLIKRVWQHRNNVVAGFTKKYRVHGLVWFEQHPSMESAIRR